MLTQPYKGARDFYPEDQKLQNYIFDTWRRLCLRFGFEEYNGPLLEPFELYAAKSGEELVNEQLYSFTDRGGRRLAIRPEMTPTVARMVAARSKSLTKPLKWFSVARFWRYENPQRGRLREFYQLNADIFGSDSVVADFEVFSLGAAVMEEVGASPRMYEIRVNSRVLTDYLLTEVVGDNETVKKSLLSLIDRKSKIGEEAFKISLKERFSLNSTQIEKLLDVFKLQLEDLKKYKGLNSGAGDLRRFFELASASRYKKVFVYNPETVRGLDYYTGLVIEQWDKNPLNQRSMYGGGRYDNLTDIFEGTEKIPATGFAMGDVTLVNFLESWNLKPTLQNRTKVLVTTLPDFYEASLKIAESFRAAKINTELYLSEEDPLEKQFKYADKKNIPYAVIIGEKEIKEGYVSLKNLQIGEQRALSRENLVQLLSNQ